MAETIQLTIAMARAKVWTLIPNLKIIEGKDIRRGRLNPLPSSQGWESVCVSNNKVDTLPS